MQLETLSAFLQMQWISWMQVNAVLWLSNMSFTLQIYVYELRLHWLYFRKFNSQIVENTDYPNFSTLLKVMAFQFQTE